MINKNVSIYWCLLNINGMFLHWASFWQEGHCLDGDEHERHHWSVFLRKRHRRNSHYQQRSLSCYTVSVLEISWTKIWSSQSSDPVVSAGWGECPYFKHLFVLDQEALWPKSHQQTYSSSLESKQSRSQSTYLSSLGIFWKISSLGTHLEVLRNWRQQLLRQRRESR